MTPATTIPFTYLEGHLRRREVVCLFPTGICLSFSQAPFKALNKPLKGRYSLLTRVVGLGQGARSRDSHQIHKSCCQGETYEGGRRGSLYPRGVFLK